MILFARSQALPGGALPARLVPCGVWLPCREFIPDRREPVGRVFPGRAARTTTATRPKPLHPYNDMVPGSPCRRKPSHASRSGRARWSPARCTVDAGGLRVLLDCGAFQGRRREAHERNSKFPFDPRQIDAVVISHAHFDHIGNLPTLVNQGFDGPVYCTPATRDLMAVMLEDSAKIQEEDAYFLNRRRRSGDPKILPLYDRRHVRTLKLIRQFPITASPRSATGSGPFSGRQPPAQLRMVHLTVPAADDPSPHRRPQPPSLPILRPEPVPPPIC